MRRTKPTLIYRRTSNLRAVQLLLGHCHDYRSQSPIFDAQAVKLGMATHERQWKLRLHGPVGHALYARRASPIASRVKNHKIDVVYGHPERSEKPGSDTGVEQHDARDAGR